MRADDKEFTARLRLDTPREREYLRHGGILPFVLRRLLASLAGDNRVMEAEATRERLRGLVEAGIALSSELSLDALLQKLVETAAELTGARYAALGVIDRSRTQPRTLRYHRHRRGDAPRRSASCRAGAASSASSSATRRRCGCTTSPTIPARSASRRGTRR